MFYNGRIETLRDALILAEAYKQGRIGLISQRLTDVEKETVIRANRVFLWHQDISNAIRRWTDGRKWSPSRVRGSFLVYYEKQHIGDSDISGWRGLCKKTLSITLDSGETIHFAAYSFSDDVTSGHTPSTDPALADIVIDESTCVDIPKYAVPKLDTPMNLFRGPSSASTPLSAKLPLRFGTLNTLNSPPVSGDALKSARLPSAQPRETSSFEDLIRASTYLDKGIYDLNCKDLNRGPHTAGPASSMDISQISPFSPSFPMEPIQQQKEFQSVVYNQWYPETFPKEERQEMDRRSIRFLLNDD